MLQAEQFERRSLIAFTHIKGMDTIERNAMADQLAAKGPPPPPRRANQQPGRLCNGCNGCAGVTFRTAKHSALRHGLEDTRWAAAAPCFVGRIGMAMAEPETPPVAAAKAVLGVCGTTAEKPLLLLGGVYHRRLLSVLDVEALSKLPPRETVYGEFLAAAKADGLKMSMVRAMQSPRDGVRAVEYMQQPAQGLVGLLERWNDMRADE